MKDYIKIDDCIDRGLYRISSRNLSFGVYQAATKGFTGIRQKFGDEYLFEELHFDTGGTVFPLELVEICPPEIELTGHPRPELFMYLKTKGEQ